MSDLTLEQRGDLLILRFGYPRTTTAGQPLPGLERVEVFELARPAVRPVPPPPEPEESEPETSDTETGDTETSEPLAAAEPAEATPAEAETAAAPAAPPPPDPGWLRPAVDAREFAAAATPRATLRGDDLTASVRGDRIVIELPVPATAGAPPGPDEPPAAHFFAVRSASRNDYVSAFSNRPAIIPARPPDPARGLELTPHADGIAIAWQASASEGIEGYNVYRRAATERIFAAPLRPLRGESTELIDREARYGERYIYAVTSVVSRRPLIESAITETREIHYRDTFPPPVLAGLVALADEDGIRLLWDESEAGDLAGYRLYRRRGDGPWEPLVDATISELDYRDATAAVGVEYRYRVTAVDALGNESDPSQEAATAIPAPPSPAAAPPAESDGS